MRFSLLFGLAALGGQLGVHARALSDQSNHIDDVTLDKRAGGGPPGGVPRPPKPPTTSPGRPGNGVTISPKGAKFVDSWEVRSGQDTADVIQVSGCKAKRELPLEVGLTQHLAKRAPDGLTGPEWQRVFAAIEKAIPSTFTGKITIYFAGGISGEALGARLTAADGDYLIKGGLYPDQTEVNTLEDAISDALNDPEIADLAAKLGPDYMNDEVGKLIEGPGRVYVEDNSHDSAYSGTKFEAFHMVYDMQLFMKVTRMTESAARGEGILPNDVADARAFLPRAIAQNGGALTVSDLKTLGERIGLTADEAQKEFSNSIKYVDPQMSAFGDDVKNWVKEAGC
ncbi:hypothetical protein BDV96DRAFT_640056 [Lophiotrema nucula]|uniref:Uncharacterized protein n=1 Tax=Lophiotrema nucula TaxID=690887 RepID=A0A6A5ZT20_9PLEO|nr:hypothetical protein BDV96DRAFT_640056 [Lophiotrema nucula]